MVEDEPLIRLGVVGMLEDAGYATLEAANAADAIKKLQASSEIRMVITDIDMPGGMDGVALAHFVRDRWPPIQLIVVSGKLAPKQDELPAGTQFFAKPYQEWRLLNAIKTMAGSAQPN